jgi:uncharacterized protein YjbI with pentapeptide repeats
MSIYMEASTAIEVWRRLRAGLSLEGLGLPIVDGRFDLRQLAAPEPSVLREHATPVGHVREMGNLIDVRGARWEKLDFSKARLGSLRFFHSALVDCKFDEADCRKWRMWGGNVQDCTFVRTNLRDSVLGGVDQGRRNRFVNVDFSKADFRGSVHGCAELCNCRFIDTKLDQVDFDGTCFVDCTFAGVLNEVTFNRLDRTIEDPPINAMTRVDFSRATLRWVDFRHLDLETVIWPVDDRHIIVHDFAAVLDRVLSAYEGNEEPYARQMVTYFDAARRWLGPNQRTGIVSKHDLLEIGGDRAVEDFIALMKTAN